MPTQETILNNYIDTLPLMDNDINKDLEKKLFQELSKVEFFMEWIDLIVAQDIRNYFNASTDQVRNTIRGNANRLIDLKARCVKVNIPDAAKTSKLTSY